MKLRFMVAAGVALACVWSAPASAQFGGALKGLGKKAMDKAKEEPKPAPPKPAAGPADEKPADEKPAAEQPAPAAAQGAAVDANGQPEMKEVKIDFVPGEKTAFLDDFSDMVPDEPPPHWKVRGGVVSLKVGKDAHVLAPGDGVIMTSGKVTVPKDFTFEITCDCKGEIEWKLQSADNTDVLTGSFQVSGASVSTRVWGGTDLGDGEIKLQAGEPTAFALWAQQGRVRAYLNGERVVDANQVNFSGIDHIVLYPSRYRPTDIRSIRLAESTPDAATVLANSGKYVSHGIHFDTDSDRLLPDSAPVLRMIAAALSKNPTLKLAINGYTDATGNADHNLDLSKRRAAAVRNVLVSQFSVEGGRLSSDGFGAAQPIGSNDTPEGRADNRRVEFVRQ